MKRLFTVAVLLIATNNYGQTIANTLDAEDFYINSNSKVKTIRQLFSESDAPQLLEYNEKQQLTSKRTSNPKSSFLFNIEWAYADNSKRPQYRFDTRETKFFSEKSKWEFNYEKELLTLIKSYNSNDELISRSVLSNDSLGNPIELKTFSVDNVITARETARYFYDDNLVEITIYKSNGMIFGIVVNPISVFKPTTDIKDFMLSRSYIDIKRYVNDWGEFNIVCNLFKYKFNKLGLWTIQKHDLVLFNPADKSFEERTNGSIRRTYKYY